MAEPLVKTIKTPNKRRITIKGSNQNFFLSFKNPHKSFRNSICLLIFNKVFQDLWL